jgi:GNAT superfamily N-acetyltransferase
MDFNNCPDVRLAVLEDVPALMDLMRTAAEEDAQHPMDEYKVFNMIRRYFDQQGALLAVIGEIGSPVAYLLMVVEPIWYSSDAQLLELSLFVHPDHRRSNFAKQLMSFSKQASEGLSLDLTIGVLSNERTAAKVRLYQRQFQTAGAYFVYRPSASE